MACCSRQQQQHGIDIMRQAQHQMLTPAALFLPCCLPLLQMWNALFWPCMLATRCIDRSIDDVSFLSSLITNMQQLLPGLPIQPTTALSGYSNGGMLIQAMLCQRPEVAAKLSGVALIGTMLVTDFAASSCKQKLPKRLPLMWIHGVKDPVLPFEAGKSMGVSALGAGWCAGCGVYAPHLLVEPGARQEGPGSDKAEGLYCSSKALSIHPTCSSCCAAPCYGDHDVPYHSLNTEPSHTLLLCVLCCVMLCCTEAGTKLWADRMGCRGASSPPQQVFSDAGAGVKCVNLCGGQQTTALLCSVANAGHGMWDQPGTGYNAGMALWAFGGFAGKPRSL